jgi:hypothetical protein
VAAVLERLEKDKPNHVAKGKKEKVGARK